MICSLREQSSDQKASTKGVFRREKNMEKAHINGSMGKVIQDLGDLEKGMGKVNGNRKEDKFIQGNGKQGKRPVTENSKI